MYIMRSGYKSFIKMQNKNQYFRDIYRTIRLLVLYKLDN